jgi:hypothetical protein
MRRLIALVGYATVGKDAIAAALGWQRVAFADALKADLAPVVAKLPPHEKSQIRPLLVEYGRTARRIKPDYWIDRLAIPGTGDVVCTDCRYMNEAKHLRSLGGIIIRVTRPGVGPANPEEERSIAEIDFVFSGSLKWVRNDGTVEMAARQVLDQLASPTTHDRAVA